MITFLLLLLLISVVALAVAIGLTVYFKSQLDTKTEEVANQIDSVQQSAQSEIEKVRQQYAQLQVTAQKLSDQNVKLNAWRKVGDAELQAAQIVERAKTQSSQAEAEAARIRESAISQAREIVQKANEQAAAYISDSVNRLAAIRTEQTESEAKIKQLERAAIALRNTIEGYGDQYIVPAHTFLDELAEAYGHTDPGKELKAAKNRAKQMIRDGAAANCDYVEEQRRETAVRFVIDAFNGKADAVLSRVKQDNAGKLAQELQDAFELVNLNGQAFRNARITDAYLKVRLEELRLAAIVQYLKEKEREEQRLIREQIREEEKAKREFEREIKKTEKEEVTLRKAMEAARRELEMANIEQKAMYEQRLAEFATKLKDAEERNRRAVSMAQQTRQGYVYIISNIGSFGENVYKIGLTRRLDPFERVFELGDSSVPFQFDVHAMIFALDAPSLERQLHKHFVLSQVNKVNHRKEFFRVTIADLKREIDSLGLSAKWTDAAAAAEYRETLAIEQEFVRNPKAIESWRNRQLELDPVTIETEHLQTATIASDDEE